MSRIKASVAGIAFVFEREAYDILEGYINRIEAGYRGMPDGAEITADIEGRIAELLLSEPVEAVGTEQARAIVEQLGYPDDINNTAEEVRALPRRLYRNADGAILGGVCKGLATYFGIDVSVLRIGVVVAALVGAPFGGSLTGLLTLAYLIMWMVVPMARTPRQKLEMQGAPITAERIEQQLRSEATAAFANVRNQRSASVWARLLYVLGQVLMVFVKIVIGVMLFGFAAAAIAICVAIVAIVCGAPYSPVLEGMTMVSSGTYIVLILLAILIPLALLSYLMGVTLFKRHSRRAVWLPAVIVWLVLVCFVSAITVRNHKTIETNWRNWEKEQIAPLIGSSEEYDSTLFDYGEQTGDSEQETENIKQ